MASLLGIDLVKIAIKHGWDIRERLGGNHPYILEKQGCWCVSVRNKLKSRSEMFGILKQRNFPTPDWPAQVR